jgi:hypothetical protein
MAGVKINYEIGKSYIKYVTSYTFKVKRNYNSIPNLNVDNLFQIINILKVS